VTIATIIIAELMSQMLRINRAVLIINISTGFNSTTFQRR